MGSHRDDKNRAAGGSVVDRLDEATLAELERKHEAGISSVEILRLLEEHGVKFSEATLRKYVQLGLLPRSVRVGKKGKHQGSQGMYPAAVIRQILRIKEMMADDLTIEQIQREFLFVRGDIEELERVLGRIFENLAQAAKERARAGSPGRSVTSDLAGARSLARELLHKLESIEARLTARAELARSAAG
jgi:DNA-binding transcriptional MerR regulator